MADETPRVTVELKVDGRKVDGFPFRQFGDRAAVPPADAEKLLRLWLQWRAEQQGAK